MAKRNGDRRESENRTPVTIYFADSEMKLIVLESKHEGPPEPTRSFMIRKLVNEALAARAEERMTVNK